jgi:hypothetical protein
MASFPPRARCSGNFALIAAGYMVRCGAIHLAHYKLAVFHDFQAKDGKNAA